MLKVIQSDNQSTRKQLENHNEIVLP